MHHVARKLRPDTSVVSQGLLSECNNSCPSSPLFQVNVFVIRVTNLPILLMISLYERQAKKAGSTNFYDTLAHAAVKLYDTLPRSLKRMSMCMNLSRLSRIERLPYPLPGIFEGLAGPGSDIDVVRIYNHSHFPTS
jgi:hypothetical protein